MWSYRDSNMSLIQWKRQIFFLWVLVGWAVLTLIIFFLWDKGYLDLNILITISQKVPGIKYSTLQTRYTHEASMIWSLLFFSFPFILSIGLITRVGVTNNDFEKKQKNLLKFILIYSLGWFIFVVVRMFIGIGEPVKPERVSSFGLVSLYYKSFIGMIILSLTDWMATVFFTLIQLELFIKYVFGFKDFYK